MKVAQEGGNVAKVAKSQLEKKLGESIVTRDNRLNYEYINENQIEEKV